MRRHPSFEQLHQDYYAKLRSWPKAYRLSYCQAQQICALGEDARLHLLNNHTEYLAHLLPEHREFVLSAAATDEGGDIDDLLSNPLFNSLQPLSQENAYALRFEALSFVERDGALLIEQLDDAFRIGSVDDIMRLYNSNINQRWLRSNILLPSLDRYAPLFDSMGLDPELIRAQALSYTQFEQKKARRRGVNQQTTTTSPVAPTAASAPDTTSPVAPTASSQTPTAAPGSVPTPTTSAEPTVSTPTPAPASASPANAFPSSFSSSASNSFPMGLASGQTRAASASAPTAPVIPAVAPGPSSPPPTAPVIPAAAPEPSAPTPTAPVAPEASGPPAAAAAPTPAQVRTARTIITRNGSSFTCDQLIEHVSNSAISDDYTIGDIQVNLPENILLCDVVRSTIIEDGWAVDCQNNSSAVNSHPLLLAYKGIDDCTTEYMEWMLLRLSDEDIVRAIQPHLLNVRPDSPEYFIDALLEKGRQRLRILDKKSVSELRSERSIVDSQTTTAADALSADTSDRQNSVVTGDTIAGPLCKQFEGPAPLGSINNDGYFQRKTELGGDARDDIELSDTDVVNNDRFNNHVIDGMLNEFECEDQLPYSPIDNIAMPPVHNSTASASNFDDAYECMAAQASPVGLPGSSSMVTPIIPPARAVEDNTRSVEDSPTLAPISGPPAPPIAQAVVKVVPAREKEEKPSFAFSGLPVVSHYIKFRNWLAERKRLRLEHERLAGKSKLRTFIKGISIVLFLSACVLFGPSFYESTKSYFLSLQSNFSSPPPTPPSSTNSASQAGTPPTQGGFTPLKQLFTSEKAFALYESAENARDKVYSFITIRAGTPISYLRLGPFGTRMIGWTSPSGDNMALFISPDTKLVPVPPPSTHASGKIK